MLNIVNATGRSIKCTAIDWETFVPVPEQMQFSPEEEMAVNVFPHPDQTNIKVCKRCGLRYDWRKSPSSNLKMTYCGSLCERADLGFTIEGLLKYSLEGPPNSKPITGAVDLLAEVAGR